ncbi:MAG TPA: RNA polymerase sigma factor [Candidatus Saccharimonadales bacterium]|nr:RNA polymerase sigma factor [Candidatus Saccharimonadales bacterium]
MELPPPLTFGQLLERHEREVFAYAVRLSGQRADAEDLYQDTFLAAFWAWPPPRRGNERAWLYRIATNRAIDRERRSRRIVANVDDLALAAPERDGVSLADLAGAIRLLPAGQRAAFILRRVEGLPYAEVAQALDCSEQAARTRVSEALKKVKAAVA